MYLFTHPLNLSDMNTEADKATNIDIYTSKSAKS